MSDTNQNLQSPIECFYNWETNDPDRLFLRQPFGDTWKTLTYAQAGQEARKMTAALQAMGLQKGDHIGIMSKNCYHWILADLAIMMGGFVSVPYYASLPKEQLSEVIEKSDIKLLFVGKLDKWGDRAMGIPDTVQVIRFPHYQGNAKVNVGTDWDELTQKHEPVSGNYIPNLDDIWTILFTSGTTGSPKGVVHSHRNPALVMAGEEKSNFIGMLKLEKPKYLSFLPLNHVAERIAVETACLKVGGCISFAESLETFAKNLQETQPTMIFAVPRIWTKFYLGVLAKMPQKRMDLLFKIPVVSGIVKKKLKTALGLNEIKIAMTGAAITPEYLKEWYKKLGIHLIEAYGMTEVCGAIANSPNPNTPPDCVGEVVPFCEVKIHPDTGEILMKAPYQMLRYYKDPEKTAEVIQDGWIYSGDKGTIDANGYVRVVGRVKDAFKTAKGQYIIPNPIEEDFAESDFIEQVCVVGLTSPQPLALINLSELAQGLSKEELQMELETCLKEVNSKLSSYQKPSTIVITKENWSEDNNLLTPTLKVKRTQVDEKYSQQYVDWHENPSSVIWESS